MKILGIDPGTARMGYSVLEITKKKPLNIIDSNVFITPAEMDMHHRLKILYQNVSRIVKEFSPDVMVVEKLFFNTNVKTAITVGQARGVALLAASEANITYIFEYTALEAKKTLTGNGRADKKAMQEAVRLSFGLDKIIKSDDANDAIAIAMCFIKKDYDKLK